jgi:hypothetical protein
MRMISVIAWREYPLANPAHMRGRNASHPVVRRVDSQRCSAVHLPAELQYRGAARSRSDAPARSPSPTGSNHSRHGNCPREQPGPSSYGAHLSPSKDTARAYILPPLDALTSRSDPVQNRGRQPDDGCPSPVPGSLLHQPALTVMLFCTPRTLVASRAAMAVCAVTSHVGAIGQDRGIRTAPLFRRIDVPSDGASSAGRTTSMRGDPAARHGSSPGQGRVRHGCTATAGECVSSQHRSRCRSSEHRALPPRRRP